MIYEGFISSVYGADDDGLGLPSAITYDVTYQPPGGQIQQITGTTPPRLHLSRFGDDYGIQALAYGTAVAVFPGPPLRWWPMIPEMIDVQPCEEPQP